MPVNDDLGNRMKEYEKRNRYYLQRRLPVIIRLDLRSGHSFTRGFQRPFDEVFMKTMQGTAKYLCENVMNCKLAYVQSDEISLVLVDYEKINTEAFFGYRIDKLCSITASMATMAFNRIFAENVDDWGSSTLPDWDLGGTNDPVDKRLLKLCAAYDKAMNKGAMFDARVITVPKEEVTNYFYWRQIDATRNSIQMLGQAHFSHKELDHKTCNKIQDMLMLQKGINWNDLPTYQKRGSCVIKKEYYPEAKEGFENCYVDATKIRTRWEIDTEIPIFKGEMRSYIDDLIMVGE